MIGSKCRAREHYRNQHHYGPAALCYQSSAYVFLYSSRGPCGAALPISNSKMSNTWLSEAQWPLQTLLTTSTPWFMSQTQAHLNLILMLCEGLDFSSWTCPPRTVAGGCPEGVLPVFSPQPCPIHHTHPSSLAGD